MRKLRDRCQVDGLRRSIYVEPLRPGSAVAGQ